MLKCCSRFVSFHLLCNESCYCCERQRDLTGEFKVKPLGGKGGKEGSKVGRGRGEKRGKEGEIEEEKRHTTPSKPSLEKLQNISGAIKSDKGKLFLSFLHPVFLFLLLLLLLLTAPHPSRMNPPASSSEKETEAGRARKRSEKVGCVCA